MCASSRKTAAPESSLRIPAGRNSATKPPACTNAMPKAGGRSSSASSPNTPILQPQRKGKCDVHDRSRRPRQPYVRAVLLTLEEKGADYHLAAMQFGTLKQEPHLSRHPFGRIPAFEHDGWPLYETRAIMRYVDAVVPEPRLQPEGPRDVARMEQIMNITDSYVMPEVSRTITFSRETSGIT